MWYVLESLQFPYVSPEPTIKLFVLDACVNMFVRCGRMLLNVMCPKANA